MKPIRGTVTAVRTVELNDHGLREQLAELRIRLNEAENALQAIRSGAVDSIVVDTSAGEQFFTLRGADQSYRDMIEASGEGAVTVGSDGAIAYSNQRFADMLRTDLRTVIGSNLLRYFSAADAASISAAFQLSVTSVPRLRAMLVAADATRIPVNVAMRAHLVRGMDSIALVIADLTEWQKIEQSRERANRALRIVSACAAVIIHAPDEAAILNGACQVMVAVGGYRSAHVQHPAKVATAAFRPAPPSSETGENPGRMSAEPTVGGEPPDPGIRPRGGDIQVARGMSAGMEHDGDGPVRVTLPLVYKNESFGRWVICSTEPDAFDQETLALLAALANDIAFGLAAQRNKVARARLAVIVESAGDAILGWDLNGLITSWNPAAERLLGYSSDEIIGQPAALLCPPELVGEIRRLFEQLEGGGTVDQFDSVRVAKDGRQVPVSLTFSPIMDAAGSIASAAIFLRDNTARKHAEQALRASETRFRDLLNTLPQKIFLKDLASNFIFCNKHFADDFRITPGEMIGKNNHTLFPRDLADRYSAADHRVVTSGETLDQEERYVVDGLETIIQAVKVPMRNEHGEVTGLIGIFWDITERKNSDARLRESELLFRTLTNAMPQMVWMCTPDGLNIYFNQQWVDYTGLTLEQSYGRGWSTPFHPDDESTAVDAWNHATRTGDKYRVEARLRAADGCYHWFVMMGEPLVDAMGQIVKWLGTCTDIDEMKRAQEELLRHRQHLEAAVTARTADLANANQALANTNKELESFSYSVSHDLRAPLRAIDGFSAILLDEHSDKLDVDGRRMLGLVREGAIKMGDLIDDILDFSRAGRTAMTAEVIDMNALVHFALADLATAIEGRAVEFRVAILPPAYGDAHTIKRVWVNLLDNAIKYTAPRHPAVIEVGVRQVGGATAYFVRDNGVGFDMQYAGKLFNLFQRLHSPEQFPGTGCGLAIVERIVTRNGGRVWAEALLDQGATIYFVLPMTEEHHE